MCVCVCVCVLALGGGVVGCVPVIFVCLFAIVEVE